jgi:hypothetical protein
MADLPNLRGGFNPLSDIMSRGNKDIQALQNDIAGAAGCKGMLEGREVNWNKDADSILQDLAEEAGLMFGSKLSGRLKRTKDRKDSFERIKQKAFHYIDKVPDLGPTSRRLREFFHHLKRRQQEKRHKANRDGNTNGRDLDVAEIMQIANEFFPASTVDFPDGADKQNSMQDPTCQYAAISFARDVMQDPQEGPAGKEMAKSLQACMDQLMENHGQAIQAGMNVSDIAGNFSKQGKGETADLRNFYQEVLLPYEDLEKAYQSIAQRVQELPFAEAVEFLVSAASKDLSCASTSVSPALLQGALQDIKRLQNMSGLYESSAGLLSALQENFQIAENVKPEELFAKTLEFFTQRWTAKNVLGRIRNQLGIKTIPPNIFFLTNYMQTIKMSSEECFTRKDDRAVFIDAIQEELDDVIAQEESSSSTENIKI